ncbi:MAG: LysM peptidoglycan-binding domain-containing protein [Myxococcales bacterium]|nr:LysM peptidoglycan-binding domain-containing protein [Myxococcales bacterium]
MSRVSCSVKTRVALAFVCGALLLVSAATPARAQRIVHRARFGETLQSIAKHYYGDKDYARFIKLASGRTSDKVRAGERIRVPTAWVYRVPRRSTVPQLAKRLLGTYRAGPVLVELNRLGRRKRVRKGRNIVVPFLIDHLTSAGETFAKISSLYYGNAKRAALIAGFNGMRGAAPPRNSRLKIPIGRVRIEPERLTALLNERVLGVSPARQRADRAALQETNGLLRRGEYFAVPLRLIRLLAREQSSDTYTAEVYKLLANAYVAIGKHKLAVRAFKEALLRQPTMVLDPVTTPPKVVRAFADAKVEVRRGDR